MHRSEGDSSEQRFTVYGLVDPRDGSVRYVGATVNLARRFRTHLCATDYGQGNARRAWFREVRAARQGSIGLVVLQVVESGAALVEAEAEWIARGRELGWPLTNCLRAQPRRFAISSATEAA